MFRLVLSRAVLWCLLGDWLGLIEELLTNDVPELPMTFIEFDECVIS